MELFKDRRRRHRDLDFSAAMARLVVVLSLVVSAARSESSSTRSSAGTLLSPIKEFGPSWAASSAHGTSIAVPCSLRMGDETENPKDAVILLLRYGKASVTSPWKSASSVDESDRSAQTMDGLRIVGPVHQSADSTTADASSKRWVFLGATAVCSMTGLASDIDYLTSVLQKQVEDHRLVYDGASSAQTSGLPTGQVIQMLAFVLQKETEYEHQRPLGVQALVVGRDPKPKHNVSGKNRPPAFTIFTLDPSGGFRHWGGGAAIGRNAAFVRKQLHEHLSKDTTVQVRDGTTTLELCLRSSIEARREEATKHGEESDQYEALLLWEVGTTDGQFCVASIDPTLVSEIRRAIQTELDGSTKSDAASS